MNKLKAAKSMKTAPIVSKARTTHDTENDIQFELELCWCVQQLENALNSGKLNQKLAEDTEKNLRTLKSQTAPLIKKRQVMKAALGDYRVKMNAEEKKLALAAKQIHFTQTKDINKKSNFVKKSAILTSGKDFRFNFEPTVASTTVPTAAAATTSDAAPAQTHLQFNSNGSSFKFNFKIDDAQDIISLSELSIKN